MLGRRASSFCCVFLFPGGACALCLERVRTLGRLTALSGAAGSYMGDAAAEAAKAKAKDLITKADKKLNSWFAKFSGGAHEDAEELYTKAANQLKVAKACA